jgi:uncharacterized membrane protein YhaH (DUF805 family)
MNEEQIGHHFRRAGNPSRTFLLWFAAVTVLLCLSAIWFSWQDKSWGAIYIAIVACPTANLVLMFLGTMAAFVVRRLHPEAKLGPMITTVLALPPIGAVVTLIVTFTFDLHGC